VFTGVAKSRNYSNGLQRLYAAARYGYARWAALRRKTPREIIEAPFTTQASVLTSEGMTGAR
jgi:hypothetical protein